jgi:hypothetical protein
MTTRLEVKEKALIQTTVSYFGLARPCLPRAPSLLGREMRQNDVHGAQACNEYEYVWGVSFRLKNLMRKEERIGDYLHRSMARIASDEGGCRSDEGLPALTLIYVMCTM